MNLSDTKACAMIANGVLIEMALAFKGGCETHRVYLILLGLEVGVHPEIVGRQNSRLSYLGGEIM